ncbi:4-hydroxybutyrate coenzyme A transferase [Rhodococcus aetherivorans]|nr:4-hydroxybutyrate coenzyme A transferase [Rhodococcus aetherivorans]
MGPAQLDLSDFVRPGDTITWGQACGEPQTLTETLVAQRSTIGRMRAFIGLPATDTLQPEHADLIEMASYCGTGSNRKLAQAGVLRIYPGHYSTVPWLLSEGPYRADVVLVQVAAADSNGRYSLGLADEMLSSAIRAATMVIAEVNDQVPQTHGPGSLTEADIDVLVHTSRPPAVVRSAAPTPESDRIGKLIADLVDDGATLQLGIGAIPEAVLKGLTSHKNLGIHSGAIGDGVADLVERGVVTGACKSVDRGVTVAGLIMGTQKVFDHVHRNPQFALRDTRYTHSHAVLATQHRLVAINSAIEVDLTGQINAEVADGNYVGAVGGVRISYAERPAAQEACRSWLSHRQRGAAAESCLNSPVR